MGFFSNLRKSRKEKEEAEILAPQFLRHVNESIDLINNTKNPEVFFFRYELLVQRLRELVVLSKYVQLTGESSASALERVLIEKQEMISSFIDRYYDDVLDKAINLKTSVAKQKRVDKFYFNLEPFLDQLEIENTTKVNDLIISLEDELSLV